MTTLEDLYYGNISPHERYIKRGARVEVMQGLEKVETLTIMFGTYDEDVEKDIPA